MEKLQFPEIWEEDQQPSLLHIHHDEDDVRKRYEKENQGDVLA